jgi:hypothetical protein
MCTNRRLTRVVGGAARRSAAPSKVEELEGESDSSSPAWSKLEEELQEGPSVVVGRARGDYEGDDAGARPHGSTSGGGVGARTTAVQGGSHSGVTASVTRKCRTG